MANEFKHSDPGTSLTQAEFIATDLHICNSQAIGDLIYASSATQLSRLGIGSTNQLLIVIGGVPTWQSTLSGLTFVAPILGVASATSLATSAAIPLLLTNGQLVNIALTSQTTGATTLTIPDFASVVDEFTFKTKSQTMANKTLTSPTINGTIATTGLTLPAVTLGGTVSGNAQDISNVSSMTGRTTGALALYGKRQAAGNTLLFYTPDVTPTWTDTVRFGLSGGVATAIASWYATTQVGLVLGGNMTVTGYAFDAGAGNAQINTTGISSGLKIVCTHDGNVGATVSCWNSSASPAASDYLATFQARGKSSNGTDRNYGSLYLQIEDPTNTSESAKFEVNLINAGTANSALTLSGAGVLAVDLAGSGAAAQVDLFDDYDDALVLRQGIQENNRELLANMGVLERKDTGSGYMMKLQPMVRLLAGGIYQTRELIDNMQTKIETLENKLMLLGAG